MAVSPHTLQYNLSYGGRWGITLIKHFIPTLPAISSHITLRYIIYALIYTHFFSPSAQTAFPHASSRHSPSPPFPSSASPSSHGSALNKCRNGCTPNYVERTHPGQTAKGLPLTAKNYKPHPFGMPGLLFGAAASIQWLRYVANFRCFNLNRM